jgi:serine phosphatase RsbU (regulator of sigma subunit)
MSHRAQHLDRLVTEKTQELQRANEWLRERDATLQLHMTVAGRLQARLLPEALPSLPEIECYAHYEPLDPLGGDHYDFARPDPDHVGILIADASGHSIPAAMVAVLARTAFATAARDALRPGAVLAAINHQLHGLTGEHFVTAFYGLFHRGTKTLAYANAGHPYPYRYVARDQTCQPLVAQGLVLGVLADTQYEEKHLQLSTGDRLCLYTDGIIECLDPSGESFGTGRLQQCLRENRSAPVRTLVQRLAEEVHNFRGNQPPSDDLTILGVQVH